LYIYIYIYIYVLYQLLEGHSARRLRRHPPREEADTGTRTHARTHTHTRARALYQMRVSLCLCPSIAVSLAHPLALYSTQTSHRLSPQTIYTDSLHRRSLSLAISSYYNDVCLPPSLPPSLLSLPTPSSSLPPSLLFPPHLHSCFLSPISLVLSPWCCHQAPGPRGLGG
jgi:hypothetical protein